MYIISPNNVLVPLTTSPHFEILQSLFPKKILCRLARYQNALAYFASEASYFDLFPAGARVTWQESRGEEKHPVFRLAV